MDVVDTRTTESGVVRWASNANVTGPVQVVNKMHHHWAADVNATGPVAVIKRNSPR